MSLHTLLAVLADGEFHSGDDLGEILGVSRTAIWKQLKKVEELGVILDSVKGKGYCIPGGIDLLLRDKIERHISDSAKQLIDEIDIFKVIGSTNIEAMAKASRGRKGYVCTAEQQTAGKGRRGREWVSPYGGNVYLSVVWEFSAGAAALEGLSLAVGVAVVQALSKMGVSDAQLKWPNDVLYQGQKLAGVLLEMVGDAAGPCQVVVGIGLNVRMPETVMIDQPWIDLKSIDPAAADRNRLVALLLSELMPVLASFEDQGFAAYQDRWQQLDAYAGKNVTMTLGSEMVFGKAIGVDTTGSILLDTPMGRQKFNGGEVSLRLAE